MPKLFPEGNTVTTAQRTTTEEIYRPISTLTNSLINPLYPDHFALGIGAMGGGTHVSLDTQSMYRFTQQLKANEQFVIGNILNIANIGQTNLNNKLQQVQKDYLDTHPNGEGLTDVIDETIADNSNGLFSDDSIVNLSGQLITAIGKSSYSAVKNRITETQKVLENDWHQKALLTEQAKKRSFNISSTTETLSSIVFGIEGAPENYASFKERFQNCYDALKFSEGETVANETILPWLFKFEMAYGRGLINENASAFLNAEEKEFEGKIRPDIIAGLKTFAKQRLKQQQAEQQALAHQQIMATHAQSHDLANNFIFKHLENPSSVSEYDVISSPTLMISDKIKVIKAIRAENKTHEKETLLDQEMLDNVTYGNGISTYTATQQHNFLNSMLPPPNKINAENEEYTHSPINKIKLANLLGVTKPDIHFTKQLCNLILHADLSDPLQNLQWNEAVTAVNLSKLTNSCLLQDLKTQDDFQFMDWFTEWIAEAGPSLTNQELNQKRTFMLEHKAEYDKQAKAKGFVADDDTTIQIIARNNGETQFVDEEYQSAFQSAIDELSAVCPNLKKSSHGMNIINGLRNYMKYAYEVGHKQYGFTKSEAMNLAIKRYLKTLQPTCIFSSADDRLMRHPIEIQLPGLDDNHYQLHWYAIAELTAKQLQKENLSDICGYKFDSLKEKPKLDVSTPNFNDDAAASFASGFMRVLKYDEPTFLIQNNKTGKSEEAKLRFEYNARLKSNILFLIIPKTSTKIPLYHKTGLPFTVRFDDKIIQQHIQKYYYPQFKGNGLVEELNKIENQESK